MMGLDAGRVKAVIRKEMRDYRRKRAIVVTMGVLPLIFLIQPVVSIFVVTRTTSGAALDKSLILPILYLLLLPTIMPSTLAAYTVAGEREQGTLEPLLTTPIRQQEFLLGKAVSVLLPTLAISYAVFALFLFAPLMAGWGILVGMAVPVRATEVRVAQQLGTVGSLPPVVVIILLAAGVVSPTFPVALEFAAGLLVIDSLLLLFVSRMFDRERLVTGARATREASVRPRVELAPVPPSGPGSRGWRGVRSRG